MAGHGPAPKGYRSRPRDEAPSSQLVVDGVVRGPDLPEDIEWHARTRAWWETWRRAPQAQQFTETDWSFLLDTALMHHTMWLKEKWEFAAELRLRAAKLGATVEDRLRLRQTIQIPAEEQGEVKPAAAADRRRGIRIAG